MILFSPRQAGRAFCAVCCYACLVFAPCVAANLPSQSPPGPQDSAKQSRESGAPQRIPRQQAQTTAAIDGVVRDAGFSNIILPVPAAALTLRNVQSGEIFSASTSGEGVFRVFPLPPGHYQLRIEAKDYAVFVLPDLALQPNEVATLEISLVTTAAEEARSRTREQNARALAALSPTLVPASEIDEEIPADANGPSIPIRVLRVRARE